MAYKKLAEQTAMPVYFGGDEVPGLKYKARAEQTAVPIYLVNEQGEYVDGTTPGTGTVTRAALAPEVAEAVVKARQGNRAVFLGNSVTAVTGSPTSYPGEGWLGMLAILSQGRIRPVGWAATGGQNTAALLARFDADVTPNAPDYVFVQEITNDCAAGGLTFAQTKANLTAIWDKCFAIGALPIQVGPPPKSTTTAEVIRRANWAQEECRRRGIPYVDIMAALINPATGMMASAVDSGDGTHPNTTGHVAIAQAIWSSVQSLFPASGAAPLGVYKGDPANLIANGTFVDSNADGLSDNWTKTGATATPTIEAGTGDVIGNWQVLTATSAGLAYLQTDNLVAGFAAGDTILFSGRFRTTLTGGMKATVALDYNATGTVLRQMYQFATDQDGVFDMEMVVPAGATLLKPRISNTGTGTGVIKIAQCSLRNLTAESAAS